MTGKTQSPSTHMARIEKAFGLMSKEFGEQIDLLLDGKEIKPEIADEIFSLSRRLCCEDGESITEEEIEKVRNWSGLVIVQASLLPFIAMGIIKVSFTEDEDEPIFSMNPNGTLVETDGKKIFTIGKSVRLEFPINWIAGE